MDLIEQLYDTDLTLVSLRERLHDWEMRLMKMDFDIDEGVLQNPKITNQSGRDHERMRRQLRPEYQSVNDRIHGLKMEYARAQAQRTRQWNYVMCHRGKAENES